jgi:integrase
MRRAAGSLPSGWPVRRRGSLRLGILASITRVNNAHDRLCEKAQADGVALDFVLYDLRHTFAGTHAQEGIDLATLAKILGHNSIRIVERYGHPTDEHRKSAMLRYEASQMALAQARQAHLKQLFFVVLFVVPPAPNLPELALSRPSQRERQE